MIAIDKAIKTRWGNAGLSGSITNGIHFERAPDDGNTGLAFPYCSYSHVSQGRVTGTRSTIYLNQESQFKVYSTTPDEAGRLADLVIAAFSNSNLAASNPLGVAGSAGVILSIEETGDPVIEQEADEVYSARFSMSILYGRNRRLA